jgi:centromeric protein E
MLTEMANSSNPISPPPKEPAPGPPGPPRQVSHNRKKTRSVDEMSRILDEMIQDRVETGQIVRGARGSVRVATEKKVTTFAEPAAEMYSDSPVMNRETSPVAMEA